MSVLAVNAFRARVSTVFRENREDMNSTISCRGTISDMGRKPSGLAAWILSILFLVAASISPVHAADIPSDDEQDVLIRTSLLTFNDANMTGNYAVLLAKASKQFQSQFTTEKLFDAFRPFREKELFFEEVATDEYDSYEKAKIDSDGALVLAGVFKSAAMQVKFRLRFIQNDSVWKVLGINVDASKL